MTYKTKTALSAKEIYEIYKKRNEIEIMFDSYKNFLNADKMYMQNRYVLEGWLFCNFLAMIAYYSLFERLRTAGLLDKMSPKDVIELSKSVYQMRINGTWRVSEIPKKTKGLFKKLKLYSLT
jgi:transposase